METISSPTVSVVLCTYNDEQYIRQSIESILNQTFSNFEFIIWDDGSTDGTAEIIKSYGDKRIRYFYNENTGLGRALNLACQQARGKYIARMDGDDVCFNHRLKSEVEYLELHPETVLVSSAVFYIDENDNVIGRSYPWTWNRNIKRELNIVHPAAMFLRDAYNKTCGYLDIKSAQDRILWSKLSTYGQFAIINDPLIKYRWIQSSLSHAIDPTSPYANMLEIIRKKMCRDQVVATEDLALHNKLYKLSKMTGKTAASVYKQSIEEKVANFLNRFIGEKSTTRLMTFLKNVYAYIKY